jgi:hypothetical protein
LRESGGRDQALVTVPPQRTAGAAPLSRCRAAPSAGPTPVAWTSPAGHRWDGGRTPALARRLAHHEPARCSYLLAGL